MLRIKEVIDKLLAATPGILDFKKIASFYDKESISDEDFNKLLSEVATNASINTVIFAKFSPVVFMEAMNLNIERFLDAIGMNCKITHLIVGSGYMEDLTHRQDNTFNLLISVIAKQNSYLKKLSIPGESKKELCLRNADELDKIFNAIRANCEIMELNLPGNMLGSLGNIENEDFAAFTNFISNTRILRLDLSDNELHALVNNDFPPIIAHLRLKDFTGLIAAIANNKNLQCLNLSWNNLEFLNDEEFKMLFEAINKNKNILHLTLEPQSSDAPRDRWCHLVKALQEIISERISQNMQKEESQREIWWEHKKDIPQTLKEWEEYFDAITKDINQKKGTHNCAYCALRTNEYLAFGFVPGQASVPKTSARLYTHHVTITDAEGNLTDKFEQKETKEAVIRSFCEDERLTAQCPEYSNDGSIEDLSKDTTIIELESVPLSKESKKRIRFLNADKTDLIEKLQHSLRRAKDGSAYGFILLSLKKKPHLGHFINYFITPNNDVFFLDAQQKNREYRVTTNIKFLEYYRPEICYINAKPPEEFKIKKEPTTGVSVKKEIKTDSPRDSCDTPAYYNGVAVAEARDGHHEVVLALLTDPRNVAPDYNSVAVAAAEQGHKDLVLSLLTAPRNVAPAYTQVTAAFQKWAEKSLFEIKKLQLKSTQQLPTQSDTPYMMSDDSQSLLAKKRTAKTFVQEPALLTVTQPELALNSNTMSDTYAQGDNKRQKSVL